MRAPLAPDAQGHRVDLTPAPAIPFAPADWVADAFPLCSALAEWGAITPGRIAHPVPHVAAAAAATASGAAAGAASGGGAGTGELLAALWCPLPLTPAPLRPEERTALEWGEAEDGSLELELGR